MDDSGTKILILVGFSAFVGYLFVLFLRVMSPGLPVIRCPHCRYENRPRNRVCWWCGRSLVVKGDRARSAHKDFREDVYGEPSRTWVELESDREQFRELYPDLYFDER